MAEIQTDVDKATSVSCWDCPCQAGPAMCMKAQAKVEPPRIVEGLDDGVLIAIFVSVAVIILLLLGLLIFCFVRNRRQRKIISGITRRDERIDENPDYGIYRDGRVEYTTVTDTNSKYFKVG